MNGGESLLPDGGMKPHPLSRSEMGTFVHLLRLMASARNAALPTGFGASNGHEPRHRNWFG
jgi:hypothetical protein